MMLCHSCFPLWICRFLVQRCRYRDCEHDRGIEAAQALLAGSMLNFGGSFLRRPWGRESRSAFKKARHAAVFSMPDQRHLHRWQRYANGSTVKRVHLPNIKLKQ